MTPVVKPGRHRVLVVGGGVAAVETLLALHHLVGRQVHLTLLAPDATFAPRAAAVASPFGFGAPAAVPLATIAEQLGVELRRGALSGVRPEARVALVDDQGALSYDTLVVAVGARARSAVPGAVTFTGPDAVPAVERMLDAAQRGELRRLVIAVPRSIGWTLPAYELAIMAAVELRARGATAAQVTLVTPERSLLTLFGDAADAAIAGMLDERGIALRIGQPDTVRDGQLLLRDGEPVAADAVVALPAFDGPAVPGLPADAHGFIPVDVHGRVIDVSDVYAAGDATTFPVKQGGLATQQADAVADAIAAQLGAVEEAAPFRPVLRGLLLTGGAPLYLRSEMTGQGAVAHAQARPTAPVGEVSSRALWWPPSKVAGRYLAPFLATARPSALAAEPLADRAQRPTTPKQGPAHGEALALAMAMAEEDARLGDYRQATVALDAAAALSGGVLPTEYAARRRAYSFGRKAL